MDTTRATLRFYWQHVRRYPGLLTGLLVSVPIAVFMGNLLAPLLAARILNRIAARDYEPGNLIGSFGTDLAVYIAVVTVASIIPFRLVVYFIWKLEGYVVRDIHRRVLDRLLVHSAGFHATSFGGSLVSQTTKLSGAYIRFTDTTIFSTLPIFCTIIFTSVILWGKAPVFVIALLVLCIAFIGAGIVATRRIAVRGAAESRATSEHVGYLADSITNVLAIKSFAAGKHERARFADATEKTRERTVHLMRGTLVNELGFSSIYGVMTATAMVIAVAGVSVWGLGIGTVFLIFTYTNAVVSRLWDFSAESLRAYNRSFGDAHDMVTILNTEPAVQDPPQPQQPQITGGAIEFRDMSYAHEENRGPLFYGFNLTIAAGEKVGLVGRSGAGKTTLATLLLRFADVGSGQILIDGHNIAQITQDDLRSHIAYVPQEPLLFHRSIAENICYGMPGATNDDVREAAARANAAEFIDSLPEAYDTLVGERGVKLSGGQRQRIAIARALLKRAPILLLDEATSALDSESERLIQESLGDLMAGRTTLVIAHRLSTIQRMDRIVVLEKGVIAEQGTHAELLKIDGIYAGLWSHQSGGFLHD